MPAVQFIREVAYGTLRFTLDAWWDLSYFFSVPGVSKNAGQITTAKAETVPFEQALKKLEDIVEAMEAEDLPLESLLAQYEEGTRLAKVCQEKLAEAEVKIQQLEKTASGELRLKPLPVPEEPEE